MEGIKFRNLTAAEVEVRHKERKDGKVELLVYKDARVDANILDETVGQFGWSCNFREEKGTLFAGIALKAEDGTWLWKWDAGAPSNFEKEKGEASDAFKRAAFKWGIGRSLYTAPRIVLENDGHNYYDVSKIDYQDGKISDLVITDYRGEVAFAYENFKVVSTAKAAVENKQDILATICKELVESGESRDNVGKFYKYYQSRLESFNKVNRAVVLKLWEKWD